MATANKPKRKLLTWANWLSGLLLALLASPLLAPQLLAFPHKQQFGDTIVYSETPIAANFAQTLEQADALLEASPIYQPEYDRKIFLTQGGWRWLWLANTVHSAFAFNRPFTDAVIINRTDIAKGTVHNGAKLAGTRSLASIIAHERAHALIRQHFGFVNAEMQPIWKVEGYCDYIARESSLSAEDVARLESTGTDHPALPYYYGRQRVTEILAANGGSVEALFESDTTLD